MKTYRVSFHFKKKPAKSTIDRITKGMRKNGRYLKKIRGVREYGTGRKKRFQISYQFKEVSRQFLEPQTSKLNLKAMDSFDGMSVAGSLIEYRGGKLYFKGKQYKSSEYGYK